MQNNRTSNRNAPKLGNNGVAQSPSKPSFAATIQSKLNNMDDDEPTVEITHSTHWVNLRFSSMRRIILSPSPSSANSLLSVLT
ncbi:hypothetical protein RND71_011665 [Anisodus tanguticus]|uniref:Uncharacterized protein n=1 Tax=Anisodus tanguticus TaxID=243964 RepID=A0AAE1SBW3_9SOLA|nr:hypothetical protein RND71_011665 [Anisodus tanguticus]